MAEQGRNFVICGAGISGLTLALALAKFGAGVVVLERNSTIQEFGAGLQISPNARKVLANLGAERFLGAKAIQPEGLDIYPFGRKTPILTMAFGKRAETRFGSPYAVMHRADLANALFQACKRFANIEIIFDVKDFDLEMHQRGVTVSIDEPEGRSRVTRPFAFIGADGVHSRTRTHFLGGPKAQYSGYVAWRTLIDQDKLQNLVSLKNSSLLMGPGFHAVMYPLAHRATVNVASFCRMPLKQALEKPDTPGPIHIPAAYKQSEMFRTLVQIAGDSWTRWPLNAVKTDNWYHKSVGLIGDAAHGMLPFQAQGAAMGIEDAALLAPFLMTEPDAETAFSRYQSLRQKRVRAVAATSARNGQIFHMRWPLTMGRDLVMANRSDTAHFDDLSWIYDYETAPDVESVVKARQS